MRTLILVAIAFFGLGAASAASPTTAVFDVGNMTCAACSLTIKAALRREPSVTSAEIDGEAGTVTVAFDAERITVDRIAVAITEAGFPAKQRAVHEQ